MKTFGLYSYITWISLADTVLGWEVITFWWIMFKSLCIFFIFRFHYSTFFYFQSTQNESRWADCWSQGCHRAKHLALLGILPFDGPSSFSPLLSSHGFSLYEASLPQKKPVMMQLMKLHCPLPTIDEDEGPSWHRHQPRPKTPPPSRQCDTGYQIKQRIISS